MLENPYSPPASNVELPVVESLSADYYVVAQKKFFILFLLTFGLYQFYWVYRNWNLYRLKTGENIWPVLRAIFSVFFYHSLFRKVQEKIQSSGRSFDWTPGTLATLTVILLLVINVADRVSMKTSQVSAADFVPMLLLLPRAVVLWKAQLAINFACHDAKGDSNARLTGLNYFWMVGGAMLLLMVVVGTMMGE